MNLAANNVASQYYRALSEQAVQNTAFRKVREKTVVANAAATQTKDSKVERREVLRETQQMQKIDRSQKAAIDIRQLLIKEQQAEDRLSREARLEMLAGSREVSDRAARAMAAKFWK
jgi:hypothetical protein